jgi:hypothetical protein
MKTVILFLITGLFLFSCNEKETLIREQQDPMVTAMLTELNDLDRAMAQGIVFQGATRSELAEIKVLLHRLRVFTLKLNKDPGDIETSMAFFKLLKEFEAYDFVQRDRGVLGSGLQTMRLTLDRFARIQNLELTGLEWSLFIHQFSSGIAPFQQVETAKGGAIWEPALGKFAKIGGRGTATDNWLVSQKLNLEKINRVAIKIKHTVRNPNWDKFQLLVSDNYSGADPHEATWTELAIAPEKPVAANAWVDLESAQIDLSEFAGKEIVLAFRYVSGTETTTVWEILSLELKGAGEGVSVQDFEITYQIPGETL